MDQQTFTKLQELLLQGEKLAPEGGHEFSGYNAKMQGQYLIWRKSCLDVITKIGEKATHLREKITKDENGAYFYQNSAQLILEAVKLSIPLAEAELKKNSPPPPKPAPAPAVQKPLPVQPKPAPQQAPVVVKPEVSKSEAPVPPQEKINIAESVSSKNVLILASSQTEQQNQLSTLLKEMGIDGVMFQRGTAENTVTGFLEQYPTVKYAFYIYNPADINSAMFELGFLVGKIGSNHVCCIHKKDDAPPKGLPGIIYKEIVVKLEEISFSLMKDLKAAGYTVTF